MPSKSYYLPSTHWPQELIDLFIDEVDLDDEPLERLHALQACSLVSRSFHFRSRQCLFRETTVSCHTPDVRATLLKICEILVNKPDLALDVRSLTIKLARMAIGSQVILTKILVILSRGKIRTLTIKGPPAVNFLWVPGNVTYQLSDQLYGLRNNRYLQHLTLESTEQVPMWFVTSDSHPHPAKLRHLILRNMSFYIAPNLLPTLESKSPPIPALSCLTYLELTGSALMFFCLVQPFDVGRAFSSPFPRFSAPLFKMTIDLLPSAPELQVAWSVVLAGARTIRSLLLKDRGIHNTPNPFQLHHLTVLRTLSIHYRIPHRRTMPDLRLLRSASMPTNIQNLYLGLCWEISPEFSEADVLDPTCDFWSTFDTMMIQDGNYPALRKLQLHMVFQYNPSPSLKLYCMTVEKTAKEVVQDRVRKLFPQALASRGRKLFSVHCVVVTAIDSKPFVILNSVI
ncbi:hypothetical protein B0H34DRAFT_686823 [Crassisporium funariophilum]|nr:hypothetical protein B0H34DRAFT_686823 [Crassisporium funariophilum]